LEREERSKKKMYPEKRADKTGRVWRQSKEKNVIIYLSMGGKKKAGKREEETSPSAV